MSVTDEYLDHTFTLKRTAPGLRPNLPDHQNCEADILVSSFCKECYDNNRVGSCRFRRRDLGEEDEVDRVWNLNRGWQPICADRRRLVSFRSEPRLKDSRWRRLEIQRLADLGTQVEIYCFTPHCVSIDRLEDTDETIPELVSPSGASSRLTGPDSLNAVRTQSSLSPRATEGSRGRHASLVDGRELQDFSPESQEVEGILLPRLEQGILATETYGDLTTGESDNGEIGGIYESWDTWKNTQQAETGCPSPLQHNNVWDEENPWA